MATRLTYTTGSRNAELDRAFEMALAEAREREAEPLTHLVGGREVAAGEAFDREDPSRREQVAAFCGWKSSGLTGKGGLGPYYVQQFAREQSRTIVEP